MAERTTPDLEEKILVTFRRTNSVTNSAKELGIHASLVSRVLKRCGVAVVRHGKGRPRFSDSQIHSMAALYRAGQSTVKVAKHFETDPSAISKMLRSIGIPMRPRSTGRPVSDCRLDFFDEIDSENKAYWLGFIAADGSVCTSGGRNTLAITLKSIDRAHLQHFLDDIESSNKLCIRQNTGCFNGVAHTTIAATAQVSGAQLTRALAKYGIIQNKTHTLGDHSTLLRPDLRRHFWRGMVDGDGSLSSTPRPRLCLLGTRSIVDGFLAFCSGLTYTNPKPIHRAGPCWQISFMGERLVPLLAQALYGDSSVYLPRKYSRYEELLKPDIPSFADWAKAIRPEPWMGRTQRLDLEPTESVAQIA